MSVKFIVKIYIRTYHTHAHTFLKRHLLNSYQITQAENLSKTGIKSYSSFISVAWIINSVINIQSGEITIILSLHIERANII